MIWLLLLACNKDQVEDSQADLAPPELSHTPPGAVLVGSPISLELAAADEDGVGEVTVYYRTQGSGFWNLAELQTADSGATWTGEIHGEAVASPALEYYFKAVDLNEIPSTSTLPEDADDEVFSVDVQVVGLALPFTEDFELEDGATDIWGLGWAQDSVSFAGFPWALSESHAVSGTHSVAHFRGSDASNTLDDYLISPALDLSDTERVQVTWQEYGQSTSLAQHSLWVSTGSRLPDDGDYVQLTELSAPLDKEWQRSVVVDLSAYSGEQAVYLAWRYAGAVSDDWFIDDVAVGPLSIDVWPTVGWADTPVEPGDSASVQVSLENRVDLSGGPLEVSLSFPAGGATVSDSPQELSSIGAGATETMAFDVVVDSEWPNHSHLPMELTLSDDTQSWVFPGELLVGQASTAALSLDLDGTGLVQVDIGVGDPDAPLWSKQVYADVASAGDLELELELTDQYDLLPPAPAQRWFVRVDSAVAGQVADFGIRYGGVDYDASLLPALSAGEEALVYLPQPPEPVLVSQSTDPLVIAPGDSLDLELLLRNDGASSAGGVQATLLSADPDLSVDSGGPYALTSDAWEAGEEASLSGMSLTVSTAHTDSQDVQAELLLEDEVESWTVPVSISVPWAVPTITAIEIDDGDGGDGDGLLEPGESAELDIEVTNLGDLDATGLVTGTLSVLGTSTASATTPGTATLLGSLGVGSSRSKDFEVSVDAGAALGDTLDLQLDLVDGAGVAYTAQAQVVLGEAPWLYVSTSNDPIGDNNGDTVDLINARYRVSGGTFELEYKVAPGIDPATAFIEMWAVATSGDYTYYRLSLQSGVAKLQGYDSSFVTLSKPTVSYPDSESVRLSWAEADMGIGSTQLRAGFGAGWCGSLTGSYCDHFPDGWGYYYSGYSSSDFFSLRW